MAGNPLFLRLVDWISVQVTSLAVVTPLSKAGTDPVTDTSRPRWVIALKPDELVRLWQAGGRLPPGVLAILCNTPAAYQRLMPGHGLWLLQASTEAAVALGIGAVADASAADRLRTTEQGRETVRLLKKAGIPRAVVFDGGHHLPALALEPEIAILPVLNLRGVAYACHIHLRDAVPVPALAELVKERGIHTRLCATPRLLTMAKTKKALAQLAAKALDTCGIDLLRRIKEPERNGILSGHDRRKETRLFEEAGKISTSLSALDILGKRIVDFLSGLVKSSRLIRVVQWLYVD